MIYFITIIVIDELIKRIKKRRLRKEKETEWFYEGEN